MKKYWLISGYWKDDKSTFSDYVVTNQQSDAKNDDDNVFYYGLSENDLRLSCESDGFEFVVTHYQPMQMRGIHTIGDLRAAIADLSDNDQLVVEIHEGVRGEDLYVPTTDLIEGIKLNDGSVVNEFRLCI